MVLFGAILNANGYGFYDMLMTRVDMNGNVIWSKKYYSPYWPQQYNNYTSVYYINADQDVNSNDIFVSYQQQNGPIAARVDFNTGNLVWSKKYGIYASIEGLFGVMATPTALKMYGRQKLANDLNIFVLHLNPANGDTISHTSKNLLLNQPYNDYGLFFPGTRRQIYKLNNGHVVLNGFAEPWLTNFPNLIDQSVATYLEYDENDSVVASRYILTNDTIDSYHFLYKIYPDSQAIIQTSLQPITNDFYQWDISTAELNGTQILSERKKLIRNEQFISFGDVERMPNNGVFSLSSTMSVGDVAGPLRFLITHASDTSSDCLGVYQSTLRTDTFNLSPGRRIYFDSSIFVNYFTSGGPLNFQSRTPGDLYRVSGCALISYCDSINLVAQRDTVCGQSAWQILVRKNPECGTSPTWTYDQTAVQSFTQINDSTYSVQFNGPWNGWIHASLEGCTLMRDSLHVVVVSDTISLNLGPDREICGGNSIQLAAASGFVQYQWQDGSSLSTFTVTQPGTYYVTATSACGSQYSDTVFVTAHTAPSFQLSTDSIRICRGDTANFSAPTGFNQYQWTPNQYISSVNAANVRVYPIGSQYYYVSAEDVPGCRVSDSVYVTVQQVPAIQLGQDISFCTGDSATFSVGSGFAQVQWNTSQQTTDITVFQAGTYSVIGTAANGCKAYDTINVLNVFPLPLIELGSDTVICAGTPRTLQAGNFNQVNWNTGETGNSIQVRDTGYYSVEVIDIHGCRSKDSLRISTKIIPPAHFLPGDTSICRTNERMIISAMGNYQEYLWSNQSTSNQISISSPGTYWLEVRDMYRCKGRDTININPKDCTSGFYVPSVFTPDNNGLNDIFKPTVYGRLNDYEMLVYNRWGQLMYRTKNIQDGWDGRHKGLAQETGAYTWTCVYRLNGGKLTRLSGTVVLLR